MILPSCNPVLCSPPLCKSNKNPPPSLELLESQSKRIKIKEKVPP
jgi:hypothetical protein